MRTLLIVFALAVTPLTLKDHAQAQGGLTVELLDSYRAAIFSPEAHPDVEWLIPQSETGVDGWWSLVAINFPPDEVDTALRVMACESGGNPKAKNPRSSASGLFQILGGWADHFGFPREWLFDPEINVETARRVWDIQGWGAWTCYRG